MKARNLNNLKWHEAFVAFSERITFKINDPRNEDFAEKFITDITISKKASLAAAKELISEKINTPVDQFFLRRHPVAKELKNME